MQEARPIPCTSCGFRGKPTALRTEAIRSQIVTASKVEVNNTNWRSRTAMSKFSLMFHDTKYHEAIVETGCRQCGMAYKAFSNPGEFAKHLMTVHPETHNIN